jgi:hypothetical protein
VKICSAEIVQNEYRNVYRDYRITFIEGRADFLNAGHISEHVQSIHKIMVRF